MKSIIASAALLAATVSAKTIVSTHEHERGSGTVKIVNRCSYPVYFWSIDKEQGCDAEASQVLDTGDTYLEPMRPGTNGGISIKLAKKDTCGGGVITQLEYKLSNETGYEGNFLDMSFVDCLNDIESCPGRTDGYYMKAGNQTGGVFKSAVNNQHCPIFNVYNAEEAANVAYILPHDEQTKWCPTDQNLDLYLCGGEAPGDEDDSPAPSSSAAPSSEIESSSAQPSSSSSSSEEVAPSTTEEANFVVAAAAAVTPAPVAPVIKTEIVYVTEYIKRRHAHGRRHQQFHA